MLLVKIILKNGEPTYNEKLVELTSMQKIILKNKGEGGHVLMRKETLKYKSKDDRENNKQDPPCSLHPRSDRP